MLGPHGLARTDRHGTMDRTPRTPTLRLAPRAVQPRTSVNRRLRFIVATSVLTGLVASSGVLSSPAGATVSAAKLAPSVKGSVSAKNSASLKGDASMQRLVSPTAQAPDSAAREQQLSRLSGGESVCQGQCNSKLRRAEDLGEAQRCSRSDRPVVAVRRDQRATAVSERARTESFEPCPRLGGNGGGIVTLSAG